MRLQSPATPSPDTLEQARQARLEALIREAKPQQTVQWTAPVPDQEQGMMLGRPPGVAPRRR